MTDHSQPTTYVPRRRVPAKHSLALLLETDAHLVDTTPDEVLARKDVREAIRLFVEMAQLRLSETEPIEDCKLPPTRFALDGSKWHR